MAATCSMIVCDVPPLGTILRDETSMLSIRTPSADSIHRFIAEQSPLSCTYAAVGATATTPPVGYVVDHTRVELGAGEATYALACRAMSQWKHFDLGWVEAQPTNTPLRVGKTVAVLVRVFGVCWSNAARIVYTIDETTKSHQRFGFAYGTLPGHAETGEERFLIERDIATGKVYYDILAFSRPRHPLARLAKWQVRRMQKRFAQDSAAAMVRAVQ